MRTIVFIFYRINGIIMECPLITNARFTFALITLNKVVSYTLIWCYRGLCDIDVSVSFIVGNSVTVLVSEMVYF